MPAIASTWSGKEPCRGEEGECRFGGMQGEAQHGRPPAARRLMRSVRAPAGRVLALRSRAKAKLRAASFNCQ